MRKKRTDDAEEFVCPMNVEMPESASFQRARAQVYEEELEHLEQVGSLLSSFRPDAVGNLHGSDPVWVCLVCRWRILRAP